MTRRHPTQVAQDREHAFDVGKLRGLVERATPGEWRVAGQRHTQAEPDPESAKDKHNAIWANHPQGGYPVVALCKVRAANEGEPWPWMLGLSADDAAFICAAKSQIPALLDEVERLRGALSDRDEAERQNCINHGPCSRIKINPDTDARLALGRGVVAQGQSHNALSGDALATNAFGKPQGDRT